MAYKYYLTPPTNFNKKEFKLINRKVGEQIIYFLVPNGTKLTKALTEELISSYNQGEMKKQKDRENSLFYRQFYIHKHKGEMRENQRNNNI